MGGVFGVVTMHLFFRGNCTVVAAPVQRSKRSIAFGFPMLPAILMP